MRRAVLNSALVWALRAMAERLASDLFPVFEGNPEFSFAEEGAQGNGDDAPEMVVGAHESQH